MGLGQEGISDFDSSVGRTCMHEPRRPDDFGGPFMNRGEDQPGSIHSYLICGCKERVYFIRMRDRGYVELPELPVTDSGTQAFSMMPRQRLQPDIFPVKYYRIQHEFRPKQIG